MLPTTVRLRRRTDFDTVVRGGQRVGHGPLVVHVCTGMYATSVGFVVSRAVGNAVTRNRVTRQLRHLMRDRYRSLPSGTGVVVRALPAAAGRSSAELGEALDRALARATDRASGQASDRASGRGRPTTSGPPPSTASVSS